MRASVEQERFGHDTAEGRFIFSAVPPLGTHGQDRREGGLDPFSPKDFERQARHLDAAQRLEVTEAVEEVGHRNEVLAQVGGIARFVHPEELGHGGAKDVEPGLALPGPERAAIAGTLAQNKVGTVDLEPFFPMRDGEGIT